MTIQSDVILGAMAKTDAVYSEIRLVMMGGEVMTLHHEPRGWVAELHDDTIHGRFLLITGGPELEIVLSEYGSPIYKRIAMFAAAIQRIEVSMTDGSDDRTLWEAPR